MRTSEDSSQVGSLTGRSQEWNLGHWACWQGPLPVDLSYPMCLGLSQAGLFNFISYFPTQVFLLICLFCFVFLVVLQTEPRGLHMPGKALQLSNSYSPAHMRWVSHTEKPLPSSLRVHHHSIHQDARHPFLPRPRPAFPVVLIILQCCDFSIRSTTILHMNSGRFYSCS